MSCVRPFFLASFVFALLPQVHAAAPGQKEGTLPSLSVISNLRSPSGRSLYLLIREKDETIAKQAKVLASNVGATIAIRRAGSDLWIAQLFHAGRGLDVHRHGRYLTIGTETLPASGPILPADAGIRLRSPAYQEDSAKTQDPNQDPKMNKSYRAIERYENDLDQEILLRAKLRMRDQQAKPSLVATAQGAAARLVLGRFAKGDDVGAAHAGQRHQPLLTAHPDHGLLKEVIVTAMQNLEVTEDPRSDPPHKVPEPPKDQPKEPPKNPTQVEPFGKALAEADLAINKAKDYLAAAKPNPQKPGEIPQKTPATLPKTQEQGTKNHE